MNIIADPGAEIGVGWTATDGSQRQPSFQNPAGSYPSYEGDWSFYVFASRGGLLGTAHGTIEWSLSTEANQDVTVSMWVNPRYTAWGVQILQVRINRGSGWELLNSLDTIETPANYSVGDFGTYTLWEVGSFTPTGDATLFQLRSVIIPEGDTQSGAWLIDNISCDVQVDEPGDVVAIGKRIANAAFVAALKDINGSPYWTTLGGRVYTRLVIPNESDAELPFVCVPLVGESESLEYSGRHVVSRWTLRVHFFCKDDRDSDAFDTATADPCADWRDDIVRAVLSDQYLSATVKNVEVVSVNSFAGGDDIGYGEVVADVQFMQMFGLDDLGPTA